MQINNIRSFIYDNLKGKGLEIGASHCPLAVNAETTMTYQDRLNYEDRVAEVSVYDKNVNVADIIKPNIIADAALVPFDRETFDFVCNSHLLEHLKDPIAAIIDWLRVTKVGGYVYFIVPDKRLTFDAPRKTTTVHHLLCDYLDNPSEVSISHYRDNAGCNEKETPDQFKQITDDYKKQVNIHVHTFTEESLLILMEEMKTFYNRFEVEDSKCESMDMAVLLRRT